MVAIKKETDTVKRLNVAFLEKDSLKIEKAAKKRNTTTSYYVRKSLEFIDWINEFLSEHTFSEDSEP